MLKNEPTVALEMADDGSYVVTLFSSTPVANVYGEWRGVLVLVDGEGAEFEVGAMSVVVESRPDTPTFSAAVDSEFVETLTEPNADQK